MTKTPVKNAQQEEKKIIKKLKKKGKGNKAVNKMKPQRGVVYFSNLPSGFFEEELKGYLSQFGQVTGVYVPRNKATGKFRGYAFVEFQHPEVAQVAADTMNNYLMFKHLIKTNIVPPEKQKPHMFQDKYSKMKFGRAKKKAMVSRNRVLSEQEQNNLVVKAKKNLARTLKKINSLGVNYKFKVDGLNNDASVTPVIETNSILLTSYKTVTPLKKRKSDTPVKANTPAKETLSVLPTSSNKKSVSQRGKQINQTPKNVNTPEMESKNILQTPKESDDGLQKNIKTPKTPKNANNTPLMETKSILPTPKKNDVLRGVQKNNKTPINKTPKNQKNNKTPINKTPKNQKNNKSPIDKTPKNKTPKNTNNTPVMETKSILPTPKKSEAVQGVQKNKTPKTPVIEPKSISPAKKSGSPLDKQKNNEVKRSKRLENIKKTTPIRKVITPRKKKETVV